MKYKVLFSLKNNEKILMNVVCCSRDWHFKGKLPPDVLQCLSWCRPKVSRAWTRIRDCNISQRANTRPQKRMWRQQAVAAHTLT